MRSITTWNWRVAAGAVVILVAGALVYSNTFSVPFLFDDLGAIPDNPRIRHLFPIWEALLPQPDSGLVRRPIAQWSFAVDYQIGGLEVAGYHVSNLLIHLLAGLVLYGIVRRTLTSDGLRARFGPVATPLAAVIATLWVVHPLQTAAITEVVRRIESLMGLFFLSTLYFAIRGMQSGRRAWLAASVVACGLGMATKERMVVAPLMVLVFDRTFIAGSFAAALKRRPRFYVSLAATWLILGGLLVFSPRDEVTGLAAGTSPWDYARAQTWAIPHYLRLCIWPDPLVLDYGELPLPPFSEGIGLCIVVVLLAVAVISFVRWPRVGFLGAWFFLLLAPSSSFIPVRTPVEEHHMYLPLAAAVALVVLGLHELVSRLADRFVPPGSRRVQVAGSAGLVLFAVGAGTSGKLTLLRNQDYRSSHAIYEDTLEKRPSNARAHYNLGNVLFDEKRLDEAIARYQEAVRLDPEYLHAYVNLGRAWMLKDRANDAMSCFIEAIRLDSRCAAAHGNLGAVLADKGRLDEAVQEFETALAIEPDNAAVCRNLGSILMRARRFDEAIVRIEHAVRLTPQSSRVRSELAAAYAAGGRRDDAVKAARTALELATRAGSRSEVQKIRAQLASLEAGRPEH